MSINYLKSEILRDEMKALRILVFCEEQKIDPSLELDPDEENYFHLGIYENNLLVAYCRIAKKCDGHIYRVVVRKEYRLKGYGRKIIEFAESIIKESQSFSVLGAQQQAIPFYLKLGYKIISDQYLDAGIIHFQMKKDLL